MTGALIEKRWLEMLLIVAGIMCLLGGVAMSLPQRDQLIEVRGALYDIEYIPSTRKTPPILYFHIENNKYKIEYNSEYIQRNITNGTLARVFWNPLDTGPVRDIAEMWVGNERLLTFELYSKLLGRWKNMLLILGVSILLTGVLWWRFGGKPLTALE
jgi:hypothetical protein